MAIIPYSPLIPIRQDPLPIYTTFFLSQFTRDPPPEAYVMIENCHRYLGRLLLLRSPAPAPTRASSCGSRGGELEHDPLALAAEALVMNHFGKLHRSSRLVRESISPYVCALKALSAKLSRIQRVGIELVEEEEVMELVFACLFLAFWEVCCDSPRCNFVVVPLVSRLPLTFNSTKKVTDLCPLPLSKPSSE